MISIHRLVSLRRTPLFLVGLLCGLFGFLLAFEKQVPLVSQWMYGEVNGATAGFNKLCGFGVKDVSDRYRIIVRGDGILAPGDPGFTEFSNFLLEDLRRTKSEYFAKTWSGTLSFAEFKRRALRSGFSKMVYQGLPGDEHGLYAPVGTNRINAYLADSDGEYASFFVFRIKQGIERKRRATTFAWASLFYFAGLFIQVFQFDWRAGKKQPKECSEATSSSQSGKRA